MCRLVDDFKVAVVGVLEMTRITHGGQPRERLLDRLDGENERATGSESLQPGSVLDAVRERGTGEDDGEELVMRTH